MMDGGCPSSVWFLEQRRLHFNAKMNFQHEGNGRNDADPAANPMRAGIDKQTNNRYNDTCQSAYLALIVVCFLRRRLAAKITTFAAPFCSHCVFYLRGAKKPLTCPALRSLGCGSGEAAPRRMRFHRWLADQSFSSLAAPS